MFMNLIKIVLTIIIYLNYNEEIPLAFFDVQNKKILIKGNKTTFEPCSIIENDSPFYDEKKYSFIKINTDKDELIEIFEGIKSQIDIQGICLKNQ